MHLAVIIFTRNYCLYFSFDLVTTCFSLHDHGSFPSAKNLTLFGTFAGINRRREKSIVGVPTSTSRDQ